MKQIKAQILDNMPDVRGCDSYGETQQALEAIDELLEPLGFEILILDNGSSDHWFKIVERV